MRGTGLDEFEIDPVLAPGKERSATADQHRIDPHPILVDQTQPRRLGGKRRAADRDGAVTTFLCSQQAAFVNGAAVVDGGASLAL